MINYLTFKTLQSIFSGIKHSTRSFYIIFNWSTCCFMIEDINRTKLINFQNPRIGNKTIQLNRVKVTNLVHLSPVWLLRKQIKTRKKKISSIWSWRKWMSPTLNKNKPIRSPTFFFFFEIKDRYCINNIK